MLCGKKPNTNQTKPVTITFANEKLGRYNYIRNVIIPSKDYLFIQKVKYKAWACWTIYTFEKKKEKERVKEKLKGIICPLIIT